jgi:hypothetical protein
MIYFFLVIVSIIFMLLAGGILFCIYTLLAILPCKEEKNDKQNI